MNEKIKALQEAINIQNSILVESQAQIRQANGILEQAQKQYKRATEEKLHLQERLLEIMMQQQENKKVLQIQKPK